MDLLLIADPSEQMIAKYLHSGECFMGKLEDELVGAFVLHHMSDTEVELKNLSIYPQHQKHGYGTELLKYAIRTAKMEAYESIIVKTSDASEHQIAMYEKNKFVHESTVKGYFIQHYADPIYENGQEAIDQLVFRRKL